MFHFLWRPAPAGLEKASFTQLYEELVATRLKDQASPGGPGSKQNPGHGIFDTLWLFNIAMENGPFIDDIPIKTSIYKGFSMAMLNNQMIPFFLVDMFDVF